MRSATLISPTYTPAHFGSFAVVSLAAREDTLRLTQTALVVAACAAARRVRARPEPNRKLNLLNASATFRDGTIGFGANPAYVRLGSAGAPTADVA
jgi:hypothetical protein